MLRLFRNATVGTVGVSVTAGTYGYVMTRQTSTAPPKCEGPELSATEWNAVQDTEAIERAFVSLPALRQSGVVLHWLHGCPYCARVRTMLDFHDIPYTPIVVDPVNFQELNPMPYRACPQLQLLSPPGGEFKSTDKYPITQRGPFIADSEAIMQQIAKATKVDLSEPRVAERRTWIGRDVARLIFVSGSNTYERAFALMPQVTPAKYHGFLFKAGGAIPLWLLAKYKITGRVQDHYKTTKDLPPLVQSAIDASPEGINIDNVLTAELQSFCEQLTPYHGGKRPDVVDVELFGLLRSQATHKPISDCIQRSGLDKWYEQMETLTRSSALTDRIGL